MSEIWDNVIDNSWGVIDLGWDNVINKSLDNIFQKIGTTPLTYLGGNVIDNLRNIIDKTWDYIKN